MKEIYREDIINTLSNIMIEVEKNVTLTKVEKERMEHILDTHIDNLCGNPEYRSHN